jgi:HSP20 family protein
MNVYQMPDRVELCLDLAGVDKRTIEVRVEPGRLLIRGYRHAPQPHREGPEGMRLLRMEIDHGSFGRAMSIPEAVDLSKVESEYRDGILWVRLPFGSEKERQGGT